MSASSRIRVALVIAALAVVGWGCGGEEAGAGEEQRRIRAVEVWAVGDGSDGGPRATRVARMIERNRPDRLLYLGDVYERTAEEEERGVGEDRPQEEREALAFRNFKADYGRLLRVTIPTPGNHDGGGYYDFWGSQGRPSKPWSRTELAGWSLIALNSEDEYEAGSEQLTWLRRQVRGPGNCRIAFWHTPRHSAGKYEGEGDRLEPLWSAVAGRAALVLNGHDHNMQHLRPIDGTTVLISGAGGHSFYDVDEDDSDLVFAADDVDGALRLELSPGRARFAFVGVDGAVLHSGQVPCRRR